MMKNMPYEINFDCTYLTYQINELLALHRGYSLMTSLLWLISKYEVPAGHSIVYSPFVGLLSTGTLCISLVESSSIKFGS